MKLGKWLAVVICAVVVAGGLSGLQISLAQDNPFSSNEPRERESRRVRKVERVEARTVVPDGVMSWTLRDSRNEIEQAAKALLDAEDDEAKATAERKLTELLNKYFEEDMERREQELAKVEERVKNLRELLAKRRKKREEIIDLQIKVLENEADGLGFFSNSPQSRQVYNSLIAAPVPGADGWTILPPVTSPAHVPGGSGGGSGFITVGAGTLKVTGTPPPAPAATPAPPRPPRAARPPQPEPPAVLQDRYNAPADVPADGQQ